MRDAFREWYQPTEAELRLMWSEATVFVDASALLGLYRYSQDTLRQMLEAFGRLGPRLWLPHRAGEEFHRVRHQGVHQPRAVLEQSLKACEKLGRDVDSLGLPEHHPTLDVSSAEQKREAVRQAISELAEFLRSEAARAPQIEAAALLGPEPVRDRLAGLFGARVTTPTQGEALAAIVQLGEERYARQQPPGYKDGGKESPSRFGDLIIWMEIIRHCTEQEGGARSAILVTDDRKEDWWSRREDQLLGPRPELFREFRQETGADFWMYTSADFLRDAQRFLELSVTSAAIEDARRVSEHTPISDRLRARRMQVPPPARRREALRAIFNELQNETIRTAAQLQTAIYRLGGEFSSNYVEVPLFFSLVKPGYGPVTVKGDQQRLRDREVTLREGFDAEDTFVRQGEIAWLAQALYRLRYERNDSDALVAEFFGGDGDSHALEILALAGACAREDEVS